MSEEACPHCGELIRDIYEYFPVETENPVFDCPSCDKPIVGTRHVSYSLSPLPIKETTI